MSDDMRRELNGIKTEVGKIHGRLDHVESDIGSMKADIREIRDLLKTSFRTFAASLTSTNARLSDLTDYVHEKLVTRAEFHHRMDGFAGKVDDMRYDWAKHHMRLDDHEKRLTRLEGRRA